MRMRAAVAAAAVKMKMKGARAAPQVRLVHRDRGVPAVPPDPVDLAV
jgi:hypothetical protein